MGGDVIPRIQPFTHPLSTPLYIIYIGGFTGGPGARAPPKILNKQALDFYEKAESKKIDGKSLLLPQRI